MGSRGRKTNEERAAAAKRLKEMGLPDPPDWLGNEAKTEWNEIVKTYPPDRFPRATWPMLESYCRHAINVRKLGKMVDDFSLGDGKTMMDYKRLLSMLRDETKVLASFGVRLGIARTSMPGRHNTDPNEQPSAKQPWQE